MGFPMIERRVRMRDLLHWSLIGHGIIFSRRIQKALAAASAHCGGSCVMHDAARRVDSVADFTWLWVGRRGNQVRHFDSTLGTAGIQCPLPIGVGYWFQFQHEFFVGPIALAGCGCSTLGSTRQLQKNCSMGFRIRTAIEQGCP